jgi:cytochrome c oxidase cbb3-type subunit III
MRFAALILVIGCFALFSCDARGRRAAEVRSMRPSEIASFGELFSQNCSGCHGKDGQGALTVGIGRPVYLAIADDVTIRKTIEDGRPGTPMPAFAQRAGGMLTDAQIEILVHGIRKWATPGAFEHANLPPYASSQAGDAARGREVFARACSSCHGQDGRGKRAIADRSYLALVTDQHLRTLIIVGMPNLGMPDWRGHPKPLTDADVADLVTWLASQRDSLWTQLNP